jgi:hypothetical protein
MLMWLFEPILIIHIIVGTFGLVAFWVPVFGRKGGVNHRRWGRWFAWAMLGNGVLAVLMAAITIADPAARHPEINNPAIVSGIFGWMMLYLGVLTSSLAWHSLVVVKNKANHAANRAPRHIAMQLITVLSGLNCLVFGIILSQPLMIAMPFIGFAAAGTNLWFIYKPAPPRMDYVVEHFKAGVGAGISCYTAFLAFGAVRFSPQHALNPAYWSIPCIVGLGIIFWHAGFGWKRVRR